ncbi:hypothetical protein Q8F55_008773 [Vanrija albida]|uniref:Uncharacterized protein n=1 Tax=Vanrija albida TaxID=181172 RepID=A0ABR3PRS1_9TREE
MHSGDQAHVAAPDAAAHDGGPNASPGAGVYRAAGHDHGAGHGLDGYCHGEGDHGDHQRGGHEHGRCPGSYHDDDGGGLPAPVTAGPSAPSAPPPPYAAAAPHSAPYRPPCCCCARACEPSQRRDPARLASAGTLAALECASAAGTVGALVLVVALVVGVIVWVRYFLRPGREREAEAEGETEALAA